MIYIILTILAICILLTNGKQKPIGVFFAFALLFVGGFRDATIGTDTGLDSWYYHNFIFTNFNPKSWNRYTPFEPGFNLFIAVFKNLITYNYHVFYSVIFFLSYFFAIKAIKKLHLNVFLFLSFCFLSNYYANSLNIMRQMLALYIGFYLLVVLYIEKKQIWLYEFSITCLAILIHKSMFMLCLFPLFELPRLQRILTTKALLLILFISLSLSIYGGEFIGQNLIHLSGLFGERADFYIDIYEQYGISERTVGYIGPTLLSLCLIGLPIKNRNAFFYYSFIGLCASLITTSFLPIIGRLTLNMSFFYIVYLTQNWSLCNFSQKEKYMIIAIKTLFIIYWINSLMGALINNPEYNPYKSYLLN